MEKQKLSEIETNIINWYDFKENSSILQIGIESNEIVNYLNSKTEKYVVAYDKDEEKLLLDEDMQKKATKISKLKNKNEFDYVCLIGTLGLYNKEEKAYKKLQELLKIMKNNCKEDGTIILVIDNKYAMKNWTSIYANKNILCNDKSNLSKTMIEELLDKENLYNRKFYYALPDYKVCNVIFTDDYLPTLENISRDFTCAGDEFVNFNETEAYQEIIKEDVKLFPFFANTYFVEINKNLNIKKTPKFISYTNIRKEKYRIRTIIYDKNVKKINVSINSKEHIKKMQKNIELMNKLKIKTLDSCDKNGIKSKFVKAISYDQVLIQELKDGNEEKFFDEIEKYKDFLCEKLKTINNVKDTIFEKYNIEVSDKIKDKMHFIKYGLWDLIFQNAFYIDNELYVYDQEWYEENIPVEFILYRAITYFAEAHRYISKKEILNRLGMENMEEIFASLDNILQLEIRDEDMWNLHTKIKTGQTLYNLYENYKNEIEQSKNKNEMEEIKKAQKRIEELEQVNNRMLSSTSWKITKPLRFLRKYFK